MRVGTPGFVGERLRQAREARLLSGAALSGMLGVTRASVSNYEKGHQSPSPEVLSKIAQIMNLKAAFFTTPVPDSRPSSALFWRSLVSTTVAARRSCEVRIEWLVEIMDFLQTHVSFPAVNYPPSVVSEHILDFETSEIEASATQLRRYWGLGDGPISDVTLLAENNGTIVSRCGLGSESLDAFSRWYWSPDRPFIFLNTCKDSTARDRFNVAHELGHLLLHRYVSQRGLGRRERHKDIEDQAHLFARAFLLPADRFLDELYSVSLDGLLALKADWNVSVGVMIKRMEDLGVLSDEQSRKLWISYNRRGWRRREPLDEETPPEEPRVLRRALEMILGAGILTRNQVCDRFHQSPFDLEQLINLPTGYLTNSEVELRLVDSDIRRSRRVDAAPRSRGRPADVIPLSRRVK